MTDRACAGGRAGAGGTYSGSVFGFVPKMESNEQVRSRSGSGICGRGGEDVRDVAGDVCVRCVRCASVVMRSGVFLGRMSDRSSIVIVADDEQHRLGLDCMRYSN